MFGSVQFRFLISRRNAKEALKRKRFSCFVFSFVQAVGFVMPRRSCDAVRKCSVPFLTSRRNAKEALKRERFFLFRVQFCSGCRLREAECASQVPFQVVADRRLFDSAVRWEVFWFQREEYFDGL